MLLFLLSILLAQPKTWEFSGQQGIVFLYKQESFISMHWAKDNQKANGFGQHSDIDQRDNHIAILLPTFSLRAGQYHLVSTEETKTFVVSPPSSVSTILLPKTAKGLIGFGQNSLVYSPNEGGIAFVNPPKESSYIPFHGTESYYTNANLSQKSFSIQNSYTERKNTPYFNWVAFVLMPISLLLLGVLYNVISKYRKRTWVFPLLVGTILIINVFPLSSNNLLVSEIGFDDPPTSASFLSSSDSRELMLAMYLRGARQMGNG